MDPRPVRATVLLRSSSSRPGTHGRQALSTSTAPSNSTIIPDDEIGTGLLDDDVTDWYTGVLLSLFGNVCINFGTNLMKYGRMLRERETVLGGRKLPVSAQPRHHRRCRDSGPAAPA